MRRAMLLALMLTGCATRPSGLSDEGRSRVEGRAIVTAESDAAEARRASARFGNPTPWTAPLFGTVVSVLGDFNESSRSRVGAVPPPERDPTPAARAAVVDYMVSALGGIRGGRPLDATGIEATSPGARAEAIFGRAQQRGFPGVVVDLQPVAFRVRSAGVGTGLRAERFYLAYEASLVVVDAADGRLIARGRCEVDTRATAVTLAELEAGGTALLEQASDLASRQCAAQLIQGRLLPAA